jgi:Family of unknown function (DUF6502)
MTNLANNATPPDALIKAVRRILRPLVRGFIGFGLTWPILSDVLKRTYVDIARDEFGLTPDQLPTDSRISLLTRVHRKDIRRYRLETTEPKLALTDSSVGAQIIACWLGDKQYQDGDQNPKPLPRTGDGSFEQLARSVSKDTHPRAILDELVRGGAITIGKDGRIYLDTSAFVPRADFENLAWYYGLNLHDHIAASTHNITNSQNSDTPAFLDRSVHYSGLSPKSVTELDALSRELAMKALLAVNGRARALAARDQDKQDANQRMTFGAYFYGGPDED